MLPKVSHLNKIKVAAVDYLNTKPLLYGIKKKAVDLQIDLVEAYPAQVARLLLDGSVDVGLVPVAIIPRLAESYIITDYCIGCIGKVASVCLFSPVPIEKVKKIYLDYQSRTSVQLAKILLKEFWKSSAELIEAGGEEYRSLLTGTTAGLVIGDRALEQRAKSNYIYDLGEVWMQHTGLPFVFAVWISNKKLPDEFINAFNNANGLGFELLDKVIADNPYAAYNLKTYYTENISYKLDAEKRKGLDLFLKKVTSY